MTYHSGWSLVLIQTGEEVESWTSGNYGEAAPMPNPLKLPNGDHVHAPLENTDYSGYRLVKKYSDSDPPDPGLQKPHMVAAAFNIIIENGDIQSIGGAFNLIAALYLDAGSYMLLRPYAAQY